MSDANSKPHARFARLKAATLRPGQRYSRPFVIVFSPGECCPHDVGAFSRDAAHSFENGRFLACILTASAAVEIILNRDSRMNVGLRGWRHMNAKLLRTATERGLPVHCLLQGGDNLKTDASVTFLRLRNQIAHGNLDGLVNLAVDGFALDYSATAAELALGHLNKTDEFILEWFNTSPDAQERRIRHGCWPVAPRSST